MGMTARALSCLLLLSSPAFAERLPRNELLKYHKPDGSIAEASTPAEWALRRAEIVKGMETVMGPPMIKSEMGSLTGWIYVDIDTSDVGGYVSAAKKLVAHEVKLPPGYRVEWGGQFEHFIEAKQRLLVVVPLALLLILFLLWLAFRAVRPALLIFFNIPFAVVGGVVALWLRQIPFSISAGVGFIALFGVSVLNGLVLVTFSQRMEADGTPPTEAIHRAAQLRLRPVLMTALVASLGFVPMAVSTAPGSEVQRPLATVVIGGLMTATALTLLLFPVLYGLIQRRARSATAAGEVQSAASEPQLLQRGE